MIYLKLTGENIEYSFFKIPSKNYMTLFDKFNRLTLTWKFLEISTKFGTIHVQNFWILS